MTPEQTAILSVAAIVHYGETVAPSELREIIKRSAEVYIVLLPTRKHPKREMNVYRNVYRLIT